jgi:predicted Rossmann fold flavoprotein
MDQESLWDVVVIGAGAAGLVVALRAAERGRRTLLLEKNRRPGVKILMSGGTRCNITHATDNRGITAEYGSQGKFLHSALASLSVEQTIALFEDEGVAVKTEETGKIFPVSDKASDVLDALLRRLHRSGATLALGEPVVEMERSEDGFQLATPLREINVPRVVVTTGGLSFPGSGTTGDGFRAAAKFGHTIVPTRPALVPITTDVPWLADLMGITLPDVFVRVLEDDKTLAQRRGSLLFAHFGLTGPVALDVSRAVSSHAEPRRLRLEIDTLPNVAEADVANFLREQSLQSGRKQLAVVLAEKLPRRLCDAMLAQAGLIPDRKAAALTKDERNRLVQAVKRLRVPVSGTMGYRKAEVTAGGVSLDEVDSRTMQSKLVPGLFFAGEVLDLDGPIGGYNFQAAWSTGWLAGSSV